MKKHRTHPPQRPRLGPRSPFVLYAFVLPVIMTLLIRSVFGGLFDANPRLAVVDLGSSQVTAEALELEGIDVTSLNDADDAAPPG